MTSPLRLLERVRIGICLLQSYKILLRVQLPFDDIEPIINCIWSRWESEEAFLSLWAASRSLGLVPFESFRRWLHISPAAHRLKRLKNKTNKRDKKQALEPFAQGPSECNSQVFYLKILISVETNYKTGLRTDLTLITYEMEPNHLLTLIMFEEKNIRRVWDTKKRSSSDAALPARKWNECLNWNSIEENASN